MAKQRVTLKFLAEQTGFDLSTISRVLRDDTTLSIRPENVERIKSAAREFKYAPDTAARGLRASRSYSIGVILPSLQNQIHAQIVEGASRASREKGYSLIIVHADDSVPQGALVDELIARNRIDGLMSLTYRDDLRQAVAGTDIPIMAVNWRAEAFDNWVTLYEAPGARLATQHLIDLGHRQIGHLAGALTRFNAIERFAGYRQALEGAGIAFDETLVEPSGYGYEDGAKAIDALMDRAAGRVTAIFALSMLTAAGAMHGLRQRGIDVPGEISVIGFNDGALAEVISPSLSTVSYSLSELGAVSALGMIDLIEGRSASFQQVVGSPRLKARASTAVLRS